MIPTIKLSPKQGQALIYLRDSQTEFVLYGGGANGGKSWLGWVWLVLMCYEFPETKWFIGREELKRLRTTTFATYTKVCRAYKIPATDWKYNGQDNYILFKNGSRIDFLELKFLPRDPMFERFGSSEYTGGWIEEGGEVPFGAYDVLKSRINRHYNDKYNILGKLFITCNPKKNWMYHEFYKPYKLGALPRNKAFIQSLVSDNIFREKGAVQKLEQLNNEAMKQRLLYGNWDYDDDPEQLIKFEWVEQCFRTEKQEGKSYLGVDIARYGDDLSSLGLITGNVFLSIKSYSQKNIDEMATIVANEISSIPIDANNVGIDAVGLGAGVVDILRRKNYYVNEIQSGAKEYFHPELKEYHFTNLRSQMWWVARELLRKGELHLEEQNSRLLEDLTAPRYEIKNDKTIKVESKDEIKKRIGRSTDYGDCFVYAVWIRFLNENKIKPVYQVFEQRQNW